MNRPRYTYDYFADPENFSTWSSQSQECSLCGQERSGFEGPFYGEDDIEFICEECLRHGEIVETGATTNDGDMESLREQIGEMRPELPEEQVAREVENRFAILAEQTPPMATHLPVLWPAHCGDFCRYVKEAGRADLELLGPGGDGQAFLLMHFLQSDPHQDPQRIYKQMRSEATENNHISHSPAVYLFKCRNCDEQFVLSDELNE